MALIAAQTMKPHKVAKLSKNLIVSSNVFTSEFRNKTTTTNDCPSSWLLICLVLLVNQCHSTLMSEARQQPTVYTISTKSELASQPQFSPNSQRPYSWNNRQLAARQLVLDPNSDLDNSGETRSEQDRFFEQNEVKKSSHASGRLQSAKLLQNSNPHFEANSDAVLVDRWPAAVARAGSRKVTKTTSRRTASRAAAAGATKTRLSVAGTKTKRLPAHRPEVDMAPADGVNATMTKRASGKRKNLVCYYGTWAVYRPDKGKFAVENIDPFLCTHVIYGFTGLSFDNQIKPLDPWNDLEDNYGKGAMKRFTNLKRINPELKTLVAIGGWNEGSVKYSKMASEPEARARFVNSVVNFLAKFNFDGLDLDWEYPGSRGGASYDKQNFVKLLRELSEAFKPRGYLLTAAVSAGKWFIDPAYEIAQVSKYLDLINLMAYDYHGGWETKTGMNAPLFSSPRYDLSQEDRMLNVNWSVNYWLSQGASREKLMLGVGSYGRSFTLNRETENGINAPASQKGRAGPYTREAGSLGYNEICESFEKSAQTWTIVRDSDYLAPYAFTNNGERQWVGYDDTQSLALKAQFAKSMGLGGMMMWSIETDDFQGLCHGGQKFPLLNTIRRVLDGADQPSGIGTTTSSTSRPTTSTSTFKPTSSTTKKPGHEVEEDDQQQQRPASTSRPRPPTSSSSSTSRRPAVVTVAPTTTTTTINTSTKRPISTSKPTTTTNSPYRPPQSQEFTCLSDGLFADPRNCRKFYRCVGAGTPFTQRFSFDCGPGTAFSEQLQACDHIYNVATCSKQKSKASSTNRNNAEAEHKPSSGLLPQAALDYYQNQLLLLPAHLAPRHLMLARHFYPMQRSTSGLYQPEPSTSALGPYYNIVQHWRS